MASPRKDSPLTRGTTLELQEAARALRREMTPAEKVLWRAIRAGQLRGLKFRRQHAVGPFILDFYCPSCKLVVEVDGRIHDGLAQRDDERTAHIEAHGYRVIRFHNHEVLTQLPSVLQRILQAVYSDTAGKEEEV